MVQNHFETCPDRDDTEYVSPTHNSVDGKRAYRSPSDDVHRTRVGNNLANKFCWKYALRVMLVDAGNYNAT